MDIDGQTSAVSSTSPFLPALAAPTSLVNLQPGAANILGLSVLLRRWCIQWIWAVADRIISIITGIPSN
jgi:hypothetical protein